MKMFIIPILTIAILIGGLLIYSGSNGIETHTYPIDTNYETNELDTYPIYLGKPFKPTKNILPEGTNLSIYSSKKAGIQFGECEINMSIPDHVTAIVKNIRRIDFDAISDYNITVESNCPLEQIGFKMVSGKPTRIYGGQVGSTWTPVIREYIAWDFFDVNNTDVTFHNMGYINGVYTYDLETFGYLDPSSTVVIDSTSCNLPNRCDNTTNLFPTKIKLNRTIYDIDQLMFGLYFGNDDGLDYNGNPSSNPNDGPNVFKEGRYGYSPERNDSGKDRWWGNTNTDPTGDYYYYNTTQGTYSFWFQLQTDSSELAIQRNVFSFNDDSSECELGSDLNLFFANWDGPNDQIEVRTRGRLGGVSNDNTLNFALPYNIVNNTWSHFALTWSNVTGNATMYINGASIGSLSPFNEHWLCNGTTFRIINNEFELFNKTQDHFVWNFEKSESEILSDYENYYPDIGNFTQNFTFPDTNNRANITFTCDIIESETDCVARISGQTDADAWYASGTTDIELGLGTDRNITILLNNTNATKTSALSNITLDVYEDAVDGDTCDTCQVDCTENCLVDSALDCSNQNLSFNGDGTIYVTSDISNCNDVFITNNCEVTVQNARFC